MRRSSCSPISAEKGALTTVPFDTIFGYGAGALIALAARRPLARTPDPIHTRYFASTALWGGAVFAPAGIVLYAQYPDWMLMYFANSAHLPAVVMFPLLAVIYAGAPLVGFLVTQRLIAAERKVWVTGSVALVVGLLAAITVLGRDRLMAVAYYDAFHAGLESISIFRSPLLLALLPCSVAITGILAFVAVSAKKHADLVEHVPGEARPLGARFGLDASTGAMPGESGGPANLPRPPQGATPGS